MSNQNLLTEQYQNDTNLNARIALHQRFSTNTYPWFRWLFDHYDLPPDARILEIGCGPADLWDQNLDRLPEGWEITLTDFSPGMIEAAQHKLAKAERSFTSKVVDAASLPFSDADFDAVLANHMLYHVPNLPKAVSEIHRVLKPGGTFYAATNGEAHLLELWALFDLVKPGSTARIKRAASSFMLENGPAQLVPPFDTAIRDDYQCALHVTEVEPLIAYIESSRTMDDIDITDVQLDAIREHVAAHIAEHGVYFVGKSTGLLIAEK